MNKFICKSCETIYWSPQSEPPPTPRWDDNHVCNPVLVNNDPGDEDDDEADIFKTEEDVDTK